MGDKYHEHDYICCQKNGESCSISSFNQALTKACSRAGVRQISVHSLRHIYATILLEAGVSLAKVSALLGHSSVHTTFEYYCEVIDERETIKTYLNNTFKLCCYYDIDDVYASIWHTRWTACLHRFSFNFDTVFWQPKNH